MANAVGLASCFEAVSVRFEYWQVNENRVTNLVPITFRYPEFIKSGLKVIIDRVLIRSPDESFLVMTDCGKCEVMIPGDICVFESGSITLLKPEIVSQFKLLAAKAGIVLNLKG